MSAWRLASPTSRTAGVRLRGGTPSASPAASQPSGAPEILRSPGSDPCRSRPLRSRAPRRTAGQDEPPSSLTRPWSDSAMRRVAERRGGRRDGRRGTRPIGPCRAHRRVHRSSRFLHSVSETDDEGSTRHEHPRDHHRHPHRPAGPRLLRPRTLQPLASAGGKMGNARSELLEALAADLGVGPLAAPEIESLLSLAAVAAHGTADRTAAPLASFLAGLAAATSPDRAASVEDTRRRVAELTQSAE